MIYTFYSFKGGVGRSMALANVAELFYQVGLKVLMVDWDLEAPGLERFFYDKLPETVIAQNGVIDLITGYKQLMARGVKITDDQVATGNLPFESPEKFLIDIHPDKSKGGKLWLLTAGKRPSKSSSYTNTVLTFNWKDFYQNWGGEVYLEWLRDQFNHIADVVLIDSRTGLSEIGGVCTYQLADTVIMFCAANQQNLDGTLLMLRDLKNPEVEKLRGRPLNVLIVPARIENSESDYLNEFQARFLENFSSFYPESIATSTNLFDNFAIPYTPRYAYNENIAVREKNFSSSRPMVEAFNRLVFAMSRLSPKDSPVRNAFPETEIMVAGEKLVGSLVGGDLVVGNSNSTVIVGRDSVVNIFDRQYDQEKSYLNNLIKRYEPWNNLYVPLACSIVERSTKFGGSQVALPESFLPPEFLNIASSSDLDTEVVSEKLDDIRDAFNKHRQIIILGEPGSGKTTSLMRLAYDFASAAIENPLAPLPIFINLRDLSEDRPLSDFLMQSLGPLSTNLMTYRSERGIVLLLDGLNELPKSLSTRMVDRIWQEIAFNPKDMVAISCRTGDYNSDIKQLDKVELSLLDDNRIQFFINKYMKEPDSKMNFVSILRSDKSSSLLNLGRNPYLLILLIISYSQLGREQTFNSQKITSIFVKTLFEREKRRIPKKEFDDKQFVSCLSIIASRMEKSSEYNESFTKDWALDLIRDVASEEEAEDLLKIAINANILQLRNQKLCFYDLLFQNYFSNKENIGW